MTVVANTKFRGPLLLFAAVVVVVAEPVGLHADRCGLALHVALRARHVTVLE